MADMSDIIGKFGGARRVGDRLIFPRGGRDAGDFLDLRQLGEVQVRANEVVVKLTKANRLVGQVDRKIERAVAKGKRLGAFTRTSRADRRRGLRARGFGMDQESIVLGPARLGKQGLSLNRTMLHNAAGTAMTAALGLHIAGWAGHGAIDLKEAIQQKVKEGATREDILRAAASGTAKTTVSGAADLFGVSSVTTLIGRLKGLTKEDSEAWLERHWDRMFDTQESIQRRRNERQRVIAEAADQANGVIDQTWEKIGQFRPQNFRIKGKRELKAFKADINKANRDLLHIRRSALRDQLAGQADMALPEVP